MWETSTYPVWAAIILHPSVLLLQELQSKLEETRRELEDQRDKDGGVFMSEEKKLEMEKMMANLDQLRKEHRQLKVGTDQDSKQGGFCGIALVFFASFLKFWKYGKKNVICTFFGGRKSWAKSPRLYGTEETCMRNPFNTEMLETKCSAGENSS